MILGLAFGLALSFFEKEYQKWLLLLPPAQPRPSRSRVLPVRALCRLHGAFTRQHPTLPPPPLSSSGRVPAGATVIGGYVQATDIDTNATEEFDFDLGWAGNGTDAADPDGFGNFDVLTGDASVHLPVAGIYLPFANIIQNPGFKTFAAETTIQGVINVDAATGGTGVIKVVVFFVV